MTTITKTNTKMILLTKTTLQLCYMYIKTAAWSRNVKMLSVINSNDDICESLMLIAWKYMYMNRVKSCLNSVLELLSSSNKNRKYTVLLVEMSEV